MKFNRKINKLFKSRVSVRNTNREATTLKEVPRMCQALVGDLSPPCIKLEFPLIFGAIKNVEHSVR